MGSGAARTYASSSNVEETAGCGYAGNRDFNISGASYTVAAWQGVGGC